MDILGSGALNLDLVYEVEDLEEVRSAGFELYPGREISGDRETADKLIALLDHIGTRVAKSGGGSSANTLCALSRLGWETAFWGMAGADEDGDFILGSMKGVDCSLVGRAGRSAVCVVVIERADRDRALFVAPPDSEISMSVPGLGKRISEARLVHLSSLVQHGGLEAQKRMADTLAPHQVLSFDPGELYAAKGPDALSALFGRTDLLFLTEEEVLMLTGTLGDAALSEILALLNRERSSVTGSERGSFFSTTCGAAIMIKKGARGAGIFSAGMISSVPAETVADVMDTTGAGDAFNAGFLDGWLRGEGAQECLGSGVRLAARSLSAFGRAWLDSLNQLRTHTEKALP